MIRFPADRAVNSLCQGVNRLLAIVIFFGVFVAESQAGDWPQILGPARNGVALDESLATTFPANGPQIMWEHKVGEGYSGAAVAEGRVVVFHRVGEQELAEGLDAKTGNRIWVKEFPATYSGGYNSDHGPRCVPVIHKGSVFLFGAAGDLHCLELKSGKMRWSRPVGREFEIPESFFGVGSTPLVEGDKLLVNVGGKQGSGIVAFALADGKTIWKATDEKASYSSPIAVTVDGVRHVIFVTRLTALSIDPEKGKVHWQFPFGARGPTVNAATPQVIDGYLFLTASYGIGAVCRKIDKTSTNEVWANNDTMSSQFSTSVPHNELFYGVDGRQDGPLGRLRCFDPKTGKVHWTKSEFPMSNLIVADGRLLIVTDDGQLIVAAASPKGYRELARAQLWTSTTRALPALSNGLLYVRDASKLTCIDLRRND
ncbi:MAG TPA: PQQ-binding-like beta-propeller repeat protein [Planctomycetaceae bacterium]|nr:PQQ-binding-like beta-propeller repeat protein [Planctomycetaceae bacterium]